MSTRMFARILGPFYAIISIIGVVRASRLRTLPGLSDFGVWPWASGAVVLMVGLVMVATHLYWRSLAEVAVSVLGVSSVAYGFTLLAFPTAFNWVDTDLWRVLYVCLALVGCYLTYVGWKPTR
ncbi:MAG TPA: hypothetical protein VEF72_32755 [Mycobacterium sp.]|nr:hypothetical protein [Mycobacterium sp.]